MAEGEISNYWDKNKGVAKWKPLKYFMKNKFILENAKQLYQKNFRDIYSYECSPSYKARN